MIISRTPNRISLVGGGLDFPGFFTKHEGLVVGGSIDKYAYHQVRYLQPFHEFKTKAVYRIIETVNDNSKLEHKAIQAVLDYLDLSKPESPGLEIFHAADLPSRSGTGSSSTFIVGLLNSLGQLTGKRFNPHELTELSIKIEREILNEVGGWQDQTFAAHGGLNVIRFRRNKDIDLYPLTLSLNDIQELESHILLFFTKISRTSSDVAASYVNKLTDNTKEQFAMMRLAENGIEAIYKKNYEKLGNIIDQSWRIKSSFSSLVSTPIINDAYVLARIKGAWGGKITGSGGGGCCLLIAPPEKHKDIIAALNNWIYIPFKFEFDGSKIIYYGR